MRGSVAIGLLACASMLLVGSGPASQELSVFNVQEFGAAGDGLSDDSAAFQAAQEAATNAGGGTIMVPYTPSGYIIGDGKTKGTAIAVTDNTHWVGKQTRLTHRAKNDRGQNSLFYVQDSSNVRIEGFEIDGEGAVRVGVYLTGVVINATMRDLWLHDMRNFAILYGGKSQDPDTAYFDGIVLEHIRIGGLVGAVGDGSGISIFPRSQRGDDPVARNLIIRYADIDVSQGKAQPKDHGPQGIKISNVDGIQITDVCVMGGAVSGITITNGARNATLDRVRVRNSRNAITISSYNNFVSTMTQNVTASDLVVTAPTVHRNRKVAVRILGQPERISVQGSVLEGDILLEGWQEEKPPQRPFFSAIVTGDGHRTIALDRAGSHERELELPFPVKERQPVTTRRLESAECQAPPL